MGRPKGSKNKPKPVVKRPVGRPPGSKNKKRRGRPRKKKVSNLIPEQNFYQSEKKARKGAKYAYIIQYTVESEITRENVKYSMYDNYATITSKRRMSISGVMARAKKLLNMIKKDESLKINYSVVSHLIKMDSIKIVEQYKYKR